MGTFIGFMSVLFIYPLSDEIYGYFQLIHSNATLLSPILGFGIYGVVIKYVPILDKRNETKYFLLYTMLFALVNCILSIAIISVCYHFFYNDLNLLFDNFELIDENKWTILILGVILLFTALFTFHATSQYRIVIPEIIYNVILKVCLPVFVLLYYFDFYDKDVFSIIILVYFAIICLVLFKYVLSLREYSWKPKIDLLSRKEITPFVSFMIFSSLNGLGSMLTIKMDVAMIGPMLGLQALTIYSIIQVISNVMDIPNKGLTLIASPIISRGWENDNRENIQDIYTKSCVYGATVGIFLFLILYGIWPDIIELMPKNKAGITTQMAIEIFMFLGIAKIVDISTGVNYSIISYSSYYRVHMYLLILLGVLNFGMNYYFIQSHGLVGAAMATCYSLIIFNVLKYLFVYWKFGFTVSIIPFIPLSILGYGIYIIIPYVHLNYHPIINMIGHCIFVLIVFAVGVYVINPLKDFRKLFWQGIEFINQYIKKIVNKA